MTAMQRYFRIINQMLKEHGELDYYSFAAAAGISPNYARMILKAYAQYHNAIYSRGTIYKIEEGDKDEAK